MLLESLQVTGEVQDLKINKILFIYFFFCLKIIGFFTTTGVAGIAGMSDRGGVPDVILLASGSSEAPEPLLVE